MSDFVFHELFPLSHDDTPYRKITSDGVGTATFNGKNVVTVEPEAITTLTYEAIKDTSHLLRPGHLAQIRKIIDDPEASANDKFVAFDLLKNACISAGGTLPMCQDTGTAIVMGKKGQQVFTGGNDEAAISKGVQQAYTDLNLRYSQTAPLNMYDEVNTGTNLPAQIDLFATEGDAYKFMFMAKGGGSANKTFLYQQTKALLNPTSLLKFLDAQIRTLGTSACPPYHLAIVIGEPDLDQPVLARLHSECFTGDLLGSLRCDCGDQLKGAIAEIAQSGSGVLRYLAQEGRGLGLVSPLRAYQLQDDGFDTLDANGQLGFDDDERIYQPAAQMLRLLGIGAVRLLTNNPLKVGQLAAPGIEVAERVPHVFPANDHNRSYLSTNGTKGGLLY